MRQQSKDLSRIASGSFRKVTIVQAGDTLLVEGDGIEVECKDGQVFVRNGTVTLSGGARLVDRPSPGPVKIGMRMDDGTVYAGKSPDTGKPMYTTPRDAPLFYTFNTAVKYAAGLDAHGHNDWRIPSKDELNVLCQQYWIIGKFDTRRSNGMEGWYWSSAPGAFADYGCAQRFSTGYQEAAYSKDCFAHVRCVR